VDLDETIQGRAKEIASNVTVGSEMEYFHNHLMKIVDDDISQFKLIKNGPLQPNDTRFINELSEQTEKAKREVEILHEAIHIWSENNGNCLVPGDFVVVALDYQIKFFTATLESTLSMVMN
jgi:hypothetical protein